MPGGIQPILDDGGRSPARILFGIHDRWIFAKRQKALLLVRSDIAQLLPRRCLADTALARQPFNGGGQRRLPVLWAG